MSQTYAARHTSQRSLRTLYSHYEHLQPPRRCDSALPTQSTVGYTPVSSTGEHCGLLFYSTINLTKCPQMVPHVSKQEECSLLDHAYCELAKFMYSIDEVYAIYPTPRSDVGIAELALLIELLQKTKNLSERISSD